MKEIIDNYHKIIIEVEDYAFLLLDNDGNVKDWNKGAEKLKGYTADEVIGENFKIFYTKEDCRRKLPEQLIKRAMETGKATDEGWRVRKDGSCFWGSILIKSLHDDNGRLTGFLKITRDLTEKKEMEEKLRHLNDKLEIKVKDRTEKLALTERQFRHTLDTMLEGVQMLDFDWRYIYVNDAVVESSTYKRSELLGYTFMEKYPGIEASELFKVMKLCMDERTTHQIDSKFDFPNGTSGYFQLSIQPIPEGIFILSVDVTGRKQAEAENAKNEKLYKNLFLNMFHGFAYCRAIFEDGKLIDYHYLAVNDKHEEITGLKNLTNKKMSDVLPDLLDSDYGYAARITEVALHGRSEMFETYVPQMDRWFSVSMYSPEKGYFVTLTDNITERKKAEQALIKSNRLYAFISAVNVSIVHIQNEQELFDRVCSIAIDIGGFKIAWIGMLDDSGMLNMLSYCGQASIVDEVKDYPGLDYSTPELRETPVGLTLRTGDYTVRNDVVNDPSLQPWREEMLKHELRASIVFPITKFGKVVGVFRLNSMVKDFFDEAEIALLKEASGDISFALELFAKEDMRQKAESRMLRTQEQLKKAQEVAHLGSWEVDLVTGVSTWSDENCRVFGLSITDNKHSTGKFIEFIHPDDKPRIAAIIKVADQKKEDCSFQYRIHRKDDGVLRHVRSERRYKHDSSGDAVAMYGICHDITEQIESEETLRRAASMLQDAQALALMGSFDMDVGTGELYWSDELYKLLGYHVGEIPPSNERFLSMVHPDDAALANTEFARIFELSKNESSTFRILDRNGALKHVFCEWKFELDAAKTPVRLYGIMQDVTGNVRFRSQIEELNKELQTANQQLLTILNTLPANIALLDSTGTIIIVNDAWNQFGMENDYVGHDYGLGDNYLEICGRSTGTDEETALQMAAGTRSVMNGNLAEFSMEYPCHSPEVERWFRVEVRLLNEASYVGVVVMHIDITASKKTELQIIELNENLEGRVKERTSDLTEANKALEAFSYSVSHDLRAPVRTIIGFARIIRDEYEQTLEPEVKELFDYIEKSGIRMNAIIDDMLMLAKYEKEKLRIEQVDMNVLVTNVWDKMLYLEPHHAILHLGHLPVVDADMSMMEQVIVNLVSNAVKYSSKKDKPEITIDCERTGPVITFFVRDNGAGFDMKHYNRLFGAFQRLHGSTEFEGTGVGLLLVKRIVEKHGGIVWAEAKVDEGATFYFTLPVSA